MAKKAEKDPSRDERGRFAKKLNPEQQALASAEIDLREPEFQAVTFRAYIGGDVRYNQMGLLVVPLVVVREDTEAAISLWRAYGATVHVELRELEEEEFL